MHLSASFQPTFMTEKRLFLLDAYALIFRAYYALIKMPRVTSAGFNTSAIFGFVNTLEELLRKENPTHLAVCFDPPGPTFRSEMFGDYKGQREAAPEDIQLSVPFIKEIIKAYRIPVVEVEGYEADDVIGTLAGLAEKEGYTTYIMSPDKDFGQLVTPSILQYKPSYRGQDFEIRGEKEVCEKFGIKRTSQVIDMLALMGDKIDNIPGCPGVGEKTAVKIIEEFGNVENLLASTERLKGALRRKVEENAELIRQSKVLATIITDVPVGISPDDLRRRDADTSKLFAIFRELEFRNLADRVNKRIGKSEAASGELPLFDDEDGSAEETATAPEEVRMRSAETEKHVYRIVDDEEKLNALRESLLSDGKAGGVCGLAVVAEGENDMSAEWIGTAVATAPGEACYIPASFVEGRKFALELMAMSDVVKVTFSSKRDYVVAANGGGSADVPFSGFYDVSLAAYLLQPEMRSVPDVIALHYLNYTMMSVPTLRKGEKEELTSVADRACETADIALQLRGVLDAEVAKEGMAALLNDVEFPLSPVLARMEIAGVRVDVKSLDDAAEEMRQRLGELEKEIYSLAGEEFNVGSPAKVGEVLFDRLGLEPKPKKTKTGQYSTSEDVLEKVMAKHPVVAKILDYRQQKKLLNTYLTALPAAINPATGKIHTNYNQTVTATGRLSSTAPNLQNIPVREDQGREIRRAFIADEGHLFLSADYSQIELRLVADFASDPIMLKAFADGDDIHAITAAQIYHKDVEDVTSDERRHAKTANFGILYGISAFGLANRLAIPRSEAQELITRYFERFPTIDRYMKEAVENARDIGYAVTPMGRKRRLADINSRNPVVRGYAERNAVNAPVQGAAADIIKVAMVNIDRRFREEGIKSKMIMQIHDELNFDVIPEELPKVQEIVETEMERAYSGNVRLTASAGVAGNWLDAH